MSDGARPVPTIRVFRGAEVAPWLPAVGPLRIAVFHAYPYLYEGTLAYEAEYLAAYANSPDSVFVLALDGERVVGAATGLPLDQDSDEFQAPFRAAGRRVDDVFYFGESVLLPEYRGLGLGHRFFDEREAHARRLGRFKWTAFAAVDRAPDDLRRPADYRPNDAFWAKRGYVREPGLTTRFSWREVGARDETEQPMTFWLRPLEAA